MLIALLAVLGVDLIVLVAFAVRATWGRGYWHWVPHVLRRSKGPCLFRNELVPTEEVAAEGGDVVLLLGPYPESVATVVAAREAL